MTTVTGLAGRARWIGLAAKRPRVVLAVGAVTAVLLVIAVLWNGEPTDLPVYQRAARAVLDRQGDLYRQAYGDLPFTYPPFAAVVFVPWGLLPWPPATAAMALISLLALWRLLALTLRSVGVPNAAGLAVLGAPAVALLEPWFETFRLGQVNLLLAWLVAEDLLGGQRPADRAAGLGAPRTRQAVGSRWSGALVGLAAGIKLTPAAFLLLPLVRRDAATLARACAAFAATVGLGFALLGRESTAYWSSVVVDAGRVGDVGFIANQSLNGALWRVFGGQEARRGWPLLVCLVLALTVLILRRLDHRRDGGVPQLLVVALAALLCSPISWTHHWVWLVLLPAVLLTRAGPPRPDLALDLHHDRERAAWWLLSAWLAVLLLRVPWWLPGPERGEPPPEVGLPMQLLVGLGQNLYAELALLTLAWCWWRVRRAGVPP